MAAADWTSTAKVTPDPDAPKTRAIVDFTFTNTEPTLSFTRQVKGVFSVGPEALEQLGGQLVAQYDAILEGNKLVTPGVPFTLNVARFFPVPKADATPDETAIENYTAALGAVVVLERLLAKKQSATPKGAAVTQTDVDAALTAATAIYDLASVAARAEMDKVWKATRANANPVVFSVAQAAAADDVSG